MIAYIGAGSVVAGLFGLGLVLLAVFDTTVDAWFDRFRDASPAEIAWRVGGVAGGVVGVIAFVKMIIAAGSR